MVKRIAPVLLLLSLFGFRQVFAVSEAAVLFLMISPSPQANAMGQSYGAAAATSPMATIMNPAALGLYAQKNFFGYEYYPGGMRWLPQLFSDLTYNAKITSIGFNLKQLDKFALSMGIAQSRIGLNLGEQTYTDDGGPEPFGEFQSYEECEGTTLALALDYYLRVSFGISWKRIISQLGPLGSESMGKDEPKGQINAHDWGVMLQLPLIDIARKSGLFLHAPAVSWDFWVDPGFYYSKTNIGGKIAYIDAAQADPIPRTLSLGLHLRSGASYRGLTLAEFSWSREIDDMLIERFQDGTSRYLSSPPDLAFWDQVVLGKSNAGTTRKRGYEINLADFYFIRSGRYIEDEGYSFDTSGYGINYLQPLRVIATLFNFDKSWPMNLLRSITFEKHHSEYEGSATIPLTGNKFDSYIVRLSGFAIH